MRRTLGVAALAAVALAYAWPIQVTGDNQNAHYALTKALTRGVPYVDDTIGETGDLQSHDVASHEGHRFTVKAPGLAMAAVPAYAAVEAAGMRTTGDPMRVLWVLNLTTSVVATAILLFLVRDLAERIQPGVGTVTAVILGLGALTLPFATLFFSHALGTTLAFASFWLLWRERATVRTSLVAAAGAFAGLAVTVEHPTAWIAAILAAYAVSRMPRVRRLAAFVAGSAVGSLPLIAFNTWAFGSPMHTPYSDYWDQQTGTRYDPLGWPKWDELEQMWFSSLGLAVIGPILAAAVVGLVLVYRRGFRGEAVVCAAVPLAFALYFSRSGAFGGFGPPRYLTPMMPFAMLPLAAALRRFPLTAGVLAFVTVFQAVVQTSTGPLAAYDGEWLTRAGDRAFMLTAASFVGITGWYAIFPYFFAVVAAIGLAVAASTGTAIRVAEVPAALAAVSAWAGLSALAPNEHGRPPSAGFVLAIASAAGAAVIGAAASAQLRRQRSAARAA
jgi:hypothetical protein